MTRTILHVDMDAFYTSVEQRVHPEYRDEHFVTETRAHTLSNPTDDAQVLAETSAMLLRRIKTKGRKVRLVGLSAGKLVGVDEEAQQLGLFGSEDKKRRLNRTMDVVRERFGKSSLKRASLLLEKKGSNR